MNYSSQKNGERERESNRTSHRIRLRAIRIYSFEFEFMNKFETICYGRKCSSYIYLSSARCMRECHPSQSRRAFDMCACIRSAGCYASTQTLFSDALQCSFNKFYRSFLVESNKAILPINCNIPISAQSVSVASECTDRVCRVHAVRVHTQRTERTNEQTNEKNTTVKILSFSASMRTAGRVDVFSVESEFSVNERIL